MQMNATKSSLRLLSNSHQLIQNKTINMDYMPYSGFLGHAPKVDAAIGMENSSEDENARPLAKRQGLIELLIFSTNARMRCTID